MTDVTWNHAGDDDTSFGPLTAHNVLGGRTAADAHPAAAVSYDNDVSGLTGDTVQEAIDELATSGGGAVDSVNGETGTVVLDAQDVDAVPVTAVGLLAGERNRGDWDVATAYTAGDVVHDHADGSVWLCIANTTGEQPSVSPAQWEQIDGIGRQTALGPGSSATGVLGAAFGAAAEAHGVYSTAVGPSASAAGVGSIAVGQVASAAGVYSTAVGPVASAAGVYSTAVGPSASAAGDFSIAVGVASAAGDGEVNIANIYRGSVDPNDPTTATGASIATGFVDLPETAVATNPAADHQRLIARTDGIYVRDESGTEVGPLGAGGGGGIPETLIDAAGDLIVGTGDNTVGRMATTAFGRARLADADAAAARTALGTGTPTASKVLTGDGVWRPRSMTPTAYAGSSTPWAATNVGTASGNGGMNVAYRMCFLPIELSARLHDVLSVVTTASGAGTSWEFGVYDLLDNMEPGVQVASLGTLDMGVTAGALQLPIAHTPSRPGWWYVGIKATAFGTAPTVRIAAQTGPAPLMPGWPHRGPLGDTLSGLAVLSGLAAGPLPATAPAVNTSPLGLAVYNSALPIAYMRCA